MYFLHVNDTFVRKEGVILKKCILAVLVAILLCGAAFADTAYVDLSDGQGNIVLAHQPIELADVDGDGTFTVYDCLYLAHEAAYEGGAAAGFGAEDQGYGLSITKLWGEENGGSYGYYLNNEMASSLADPISDGDVLHAYVYTDLEAWSDTYSYFESEVMESSDGSAALTLLSQYFDANWQSVTAPVEGAVIWVDGSETSFTTDADGKVLLTGLTTGEHVVTARSSEVVLVPPVCMITVS